MPKKDLPRYHNLQSYFGDFSHLWYAVHIIVITACQQLSQLCLFLFLGNAKKYNSELHYTGRTFLSRISFGCEISSYWPKDY